MPFIPHSDADTKAMLTALNANTIDELYDEVPEDIPAADISDIPAPLTEQAITRLMLEREPENKHTLNFIGAGAYEHHSPAAVWDITQRRILYRLHPLSS